MRHIAFALLALAALSACTTASGPTSAVTPRGVAGPSGPIDLGDWRRSSQSAVVQRFSGALSRRYAAGSPLSAAAADLRANAFTCLAPIAGRSGDPPDQVCRRTVAEGDCTHTWQAHLWDDAPGVAAKITRVRGLYDKRCKADDGLLGGPGR